MAAPQYKAVLIATPQMRSESGLTFPSKQSAGLLTHAVGAEAASQQEKLAICPDSTSSGVECTVTAELKKGKYVYYRCSGYRGKRPLPRFREEQIAEKLGQILKDIQIPDAAVARIERSLDRIRIQRRDRTANEQAHLQQRLAEVRRRMDQAYTDKLDGKIPEDFWQRRMVDWQAEKQKINITLAALRTENNDRIADAKRILELANKAYFLYVARKPAEQARLLKKVLLNGAIDGTSVYPTYRKPFDVIFKRAKREEWSGRADLNCRPLAPQASALPG